jgi:hypothetical protein
MAGTKQIKTALVSVFHKDGLEELLAKLNSEGVKFLSTGGTQKFIESLGYECQTVESVTTYPSILGGRVKTLHPKIFGGILARRDNEGDKEQMKQYDIPSIDLVVVDLYPLSRPLLWALLPKTSSRRLISAVYLLSVQVQRTSKMWLLFLQRLNTVCYLTY